VNNVDLKAAVVAATAQRSTVVLATGRVGAELHSLTFVA